jgi:hypothetical protein
VDSNGTSKIPATTQLTPRRPGLEAWVLLKSDCPSGIVGYDVEEGRDVVVVKAKVVDSTHLELSEPLAVRKGLTVLVSVAEPGEKDAERQQWLAASAERLQAAYGESEPDYPASMVKESNPDFGT